MTRFIREMIFNIKFYFWEREVIKQIEKEHGKESKRKEDLDRNETIQ